MTNIACVAAGRVTIKIPDIVRLRNGSTEIRGFISDWLVSYTPCDLSYSCETYHAKLKINMVACILYLLLLCISKIEKAMSDSSVYCNLCSRVIEKRNERVLLSYVWKQFDVFTEIESVEISLTIPAV